jgi:16S rRNA processing protein RimM
MASDDEIYVAKLGKTVGLDGSLKIYSESDFPQQFKKGAAFTTNKGLTLVVKTYNHNRGIIKFDTIDTPDEAKKLINQQLFTTIEATRKACSLNENEFFWFDLMGCKIIDDNNMQLGEVKEIQRLPSSDYFEIETTKELQEKGLPKIFLIPYIELYVTNIDLSSKVIYTKDCFAILENS